MQKCFCKLSTICSRKWGTKLIFENFGLIDSLAIATTAEIFRIYIFHGSIFIFCTSEDILSVPLNFSFCHVKSFQFCCKSGKYYTDNSSSHFMSFTKLHRLFIQYSKSKTIINKLIVDDRKYMTIYKFEQLRGALYEIYNVMA